MKNVICHNGIARGRKVCDNCSNLINCFCIEYVDSKGYRKNIVEIQKCCFGIPLDFNVRKCSHFKVRR